jgi:hypothetical protein
VVVLAFCTGDGAGNLMGFDDICREVAVFLDASFGILTLQQTAVSTRN